MASMASQQPNRRVDCLSSIGPLCITTSIGGARWPASRGDRRGTPGANRPAGADRRRCSATTDRPINASDPAPRHRAGVVLERQNRTRVQCAHARSRYCFGQQTGFAVAGLAHAVGIAGALLFRRAAGGGSVPPSQKTGRRKPVFPVPGCGASAVQSHTTSSGTDCRLGRTALPHYPLVGQRLDSIQPARYLPFQSSPTSLPRLTSVPA